MKNLISTSNIKQLFAIVLLLSFPVQAQESGTGGWRYGEKQIRINTDNPGILRPFFDLKLNMDMEGPFYDHITAYVTPNELSKIEALGIPYIIEIEDLNEYNRDFWEIEEAYHTYQEIIDLADSLVLNFPGICKKYIFGYSIGNRQCAALKISDNILTDEPEAEVMFDGGIHGDEVGGSENIIRFARDLCIKYGTDPVITGLVNNREIWLYLMVNPDGRYNNTRYNMNMVDLNRDWFYMWDLEGSSPGPCSQVETKALRKCFYENQFVVHTTYHSGTEFVSYPWSYRPDQARDYTMIHQLAGVYSSVSGYPNLPYGPGYSGMYPINGSTKDGNYGIMGSISWSIEISTSKHPPVSQIMTYYNRNYPSMVALIERAGYGVWGTVTDAVSGLPIKGIVSVNNYFPVYTDSTAGDYHKYLLPGTYSVTVSANGYQSQTVSLVEVTANNATTLNFQLQPNAKYYAYRLSVCQIPNNNFTDEGWTAGALGIPQGINYSIGKNGWCVLDMQYSIIDRSGMDFTVYEGDATPEGYNCYVSQSMDGPWYLTGSGLGTTQFDISPVGIANLRFIKIVDDGDGQSNVPDAGFDLDAIELLTAPIPVELVEFTGEVNEGMISLKWSTASEINNRGFTIERKETPNGNAGVTLPQIKIEWESRGFVEGKGTTTETSHYIFNDKVELGNYSYRLKQIDYSGSSNYSDVIEVSNMYLEEFVLFQNYPNPFNPVTTIYFSLPEQSEVTGSLFNSLGEQVQFLIRDQLDAGFHSLRFDGSGLSSGTYVYQLKVRSGDRIVIQSRKMSIVK